MAAGSLPPLLRSIMNHYEVLGVDKDADDAEIKKAYRQKAKQHHPDREGGDHQTMTAIVKAYQVLKDPDTRKRYDDTGKDGKSTVEADAVALIADAFSDYIEKGGEENPLPLINKELKRMIAESARHIDVQKQKIRMYEKKQKVIRRKGKGRDLYAMVLETKIQQSNNLIAQHKETGEMFEIAVALIADYECDIPEQRAKTMDQMMAEAMRKANENMISNSVFFSNNGKPFG